MNKIKDIKTSEQRQELLQQILDKQLLELRKICFRYSSKNLLSNKIIIKEADLSDLNAQGLWEQEDKKNEYRYTHSISVSPILITEYLNYKRGRWDRWSRCTKKWYKKRLIDTVKHEIIHGFVMEEYELWSDITNCHNDASPIFLSVMAFLGGVSNHKSASIFNKTQEYYNIKKMKDWTEFNTYITKLILKYNRVTKKLKSKTIDDKINDSTYITSNGFTFASREVGLEGVCSGVDLVKDMATKRTVNVQLNHFSIGACIQPEALEKLMDKKINNDNFTTKTKENMYVKDNFLCVKCDGKLIKRKIDAKSPVNLAIN